MTIILSPDNMSPGQHSAVNKKNIIGFVYINGKNFGFSLIKLFQKTFSEISLFSDHYFNYFDHCYHYHYQCHDYHHYHYHSHYHYGHGYHYYHHCYHYNDYHQFYHHYHDYHCQHYYH